MKVTFKENSVYIQYVTNFPEFHVTLAWKKNSRLVLTITYSHLTNFVKRKYNINYISTASFQLEDKWHIKKVNL